MAAVSQLTRYDYNKFLQAGAASRIGERGEGDNLDKTWPIRWISTGFVVGGGVRGPKKVMTSSLGRKNPQNILPALSGLLEEIQDNCKKSFSLTLIRSGHQLIETKSITQQSSLAFNTKSHCRPMVILIDFFF